MDPVQISVKHELKVDLHLDAAGPTTGWVDLIFLVVKSSPTPVTSLALLEYADGKLVRELRHFRRTFLVTSVDSFDRVESWPVTSFNVV
jgi:hypothetical protein